MRVPFLPVAVALAVWLFSTTPQQASGQAMTGEWFNEDRPSVNAAAVTPSDTVDLPNPTFNVWIGGAGNLKVDMKSGQTVTFTGVPVGTMLHIQARRIYATGTTATNIVALY